MSDDEQAIDEDIVASITEVKPRVESIKRLEMEISGCSGVPALKIKTLEGIELVVSVSVNGYRIEECSRQLKMKDFDSLHALLSETSKAYVQKFGTSLEEALLALSEKDG
uniref:GSKIP domain-containing protein n=1 Tax=Guillardia theta TaxID=55529 RepID=A0A7S4P374_GUITH